MPAPVKVGAVPGVMNVPLPYAVPFVALVELDTVEFVVMFEAKREWGVGVFRGMLAFGGLLMGKGKGEGVIGMVG